jgi:hypothetical protein
MPPMIAGVTRRGSHSGHGRPAVRSLTSASMSWYWRLEDPSGAELDPAAVGVEVPRAENQGDAESWLGENWRDLLERGVATVTLFDGGRQVYGPMGLAAT